MQNKPNLLNAQINITAFIISNYEENRPFCPRKNKPNSNPIKPNYKKAEMNVSAVITKQYEDYRLPALTKNKPKQTQTNPIIRFLPGLRCKRRHGRGNRRWTVLVRPGFQIQGVNWDYSKGIIFNLLKPFFKWVELLE